MTYESVIRMNSYEGFAMPTIFHRENIKASGVINFASLAGVVGMPGYVLFLASKNGQFLSKRPPNTPCVIKRAPTCAATGRLSHSHAASAGV